MRNLHPEEQYLDLAKEILKDGIWQKDQGTGVRTKSIFGRQSIYDLSKDLHLNWETIASIAKTDSRLGNTHWAVPGPDGKRGFGGACFPKDTEALINIASTTATDMSMLKTAIEKNKKLKST